MRTTQAMVLFWRTADIYSNWHASPFVRDGVSYSNAEQYMMAAKARLFGDAEVEAKIMATKGSDPNRMKSLGREVRGYVEAVWVAHRDWVMFDACLAKFSQDPALKAQLLATGNRILVEASPYDRVWGIGLAEDDPRAQDPALWRGLNLLGIALMRVRDTLRNLDAAEEAKKPKVQIELFKAGYDGHPYPWNFAVTFEGTRHRYAGLPNQCETPEEAFQRAAERLGWMQDGSYAERYATPLLGGAG